MDTRLKDRVAVITGASSGLGKATALKFAACGAKVICADLKSIGLEQEICTQHGNDRALFVACDVTQESQVQNLIQEAVKFGGRLDIMCNYAGIAIETNPQHQMRSRTHDFPTEDFDREMAINTRGVWLCCKYALQQMLLQEPLAPNARNERTRGWIVNVASILGLRAHANLPAYVPSKFAVVGMTKQMALDYAEDRIHVNAICPGFVRTPMIASFVATEEMEKGLEGKHAWKALGRPEDVADAAVFLCSEESAWMTGHALVVDGGYTLK